MEIPVSFKKDILLSNYSTFGIGGPATFFTEVTTIETMQKVIRYAYEKGLRYFILGKGSNCLFDDHGYDGLVIYNRIDYLKQNENLFEVGAGYSFARLGGQTARLGFSGLEFASGIPASLGGAVYMNAGANGKETFQHLVEVQFINEKGDLEILKKELLTFDYRFSSFQTKKGVIVSALFELTASDKAKEMQKEILGYRLNTQPYGEKSAGCVFRNLPCHAAGALIDQCGLKGFSVGDAQVSTQHANFIVNKGNAGSKQILELIKIIKERIFAQYGYTLEEEIRWIPYKDE